MKIRIININLNNTKRKILMYLLYNMIYYIAGNYIIGNENDFYYFFFFFYNSRYTFILFFSFAYKDEFILI